MTIDRDRNTSNEHGAEHGSGGQAVMSVVTTPMQSRRPSYSHDSIDDSDCESQRNATAHDNDQQQQNKGKDEESAATPAADASKDENDHVFTLNGQEDPLNWPDAQKWFLTILVSLAFVNTTLASSMATGAMQFYMQGFGASQEVATLALSCYMIGFSFGPLIWSPLSELLGRRLVFTIAIPLFCFMNIGCALSQNMATLLVLRVFAGFFGACPQSAAGGTISDIWSPAQRPWPMLCYSASAFLGPVIGPLTGGFLYVSGNWRWIYWLLAIFAGVNSILLLSLQSETYGPVLRRKKAKRLRKESPESFSNNEKAPIEMHMTAKDIVSIYLVRPFTMLFSPYELPLIYAAFWTGWAYALLFIFFEAYPVIFNGIYGFNAGQTGLCFLAFGLGIGCGIPVIGYYNNQTIKHVKQGRKVIPESRLSMANITAPLYLIGFFWFGWTSRKDIHWIVPLIGTIPIGTATILSFNSLAIYVAQCYHIYAASALGSMAFSRCFLAIFVPLFGRQMYEGLGPGWASSILGFISLIAIPIPFIFGRYGEQIRRRSKLAISV